MSLSFLSILINEWIRGELIAVSLKRTPPRAFKIKQFPQQNLLTPYLRNVPTNCYCSIVMKLWNVFAASFNWLQRFQLLQVSLNFSAWIWPSSINYILHLAKQESFIICYRVERNEFVSRDVQFAKKWAIYSCAWQMHNFYSTWHVKLYKIELIVGIHVHFMRET